MVGATRGGDGTPTPPPPPPPVNWRRRPRTTRRRSDGRSNARGRRHARCWRTRVKRRPRPTFFEIVHRFHESISGCAFFQDNAPRPLTLGSQCPLRKQGGIIHSNLSFTKD